METILKRIMQSLLFNQTTKLLATGAVMVGIYIVALIVFSKFLNLLLS